MAPPGDVFLMADKPAGNYIRLGYQSIDVNMIETGVMTLAEVFKEIQSGQRIGCGRPEVSAA